MMFFSKKKKLLDWLKELAVMMHLKHLLGNVHVMSLASVHTELEALRFLLVR